MNLVSNAAPLVKSLQAALPANASAQRTEAFAEFLRLGLPTAKVDAWKYTDLRRLAAREFRVATASSPIAQINALLPIPATRIIFVDGVFSESMSTLHPSPALVVRVERTEGAVPTINLQARSQQSAFEILNTALSTNQISVDVLANESLTQPIYVAFVWTETASALMSHPRIAVRIAPYARAQLIEHHIGLNEAGNFFNGIVNIDIAEHAELLHARIQEDAPSNFAVAKVNVTVASDARYLSHQYALSSGLARCDIEVQLNGRDAHCELHGLLLANASEHVDVRTIVDHRTPNTRSIEDYRGIADGRGRVIFNGKVIVQPDAQKTDARQSSRNLLLSPTAEIDTRPELEIYANDVQCAHGATVGQLDAAALFYLQSRGLSASDARALLTHAFAAELLERLPHTELREYILGRLMQRLGSKGPRL